MNILIIEDDIELVESIKDLLILNNYNITSVDNAYDAEDILLNDTNENMLFDLILCDINLKGKLSGIQLMEDMKNIGFNIPIIFITAMVDIDTIKKAYNIGILDYIKKPFEPLELLLKLENFDNTFKNKHKKSSINYKGININYQLNSLSINKELIHLSQQEMNIVIELLENKGDIVIKEDLMNILNTDNEVFLRVTINRIKTKTNNILDIKNIRGQGYLIEKE